MAQTLSAMQFVFASTNGPSQALALLNETLHANVIRGMFVTTLVGKLTPETRVVEIASAGHCQPLLVKADGSASKIETAAALPLGIMRKTTYSQASAILEKCDRLVVYTDGLSESRSEADGSMFDDQLLARAGGPASGARELLDRIVSAERAHRGGGPQLDDLTILVGGFE